MTYGIYFIEKTRAQLCASVHTTTDEMIVEMLVEGGEIRVENEE